MGLGVSMSDLRKAAQALVDRWDTPLWKDVPHTGVFIDALRAALAEPEPCADEFDCDHMPWCRIRKTCQKQARAALAQPDESFCDSHCTWHDHHPDCALAQPERKPLTDQEIIEAIKHISHNEMSAFAIARAIESVLKNASSEANKGTYDNP